MCTLFVSFFLLASCNTPRMGLCSHGSEFLPLVNFANLCANLQVEKTPLVRKFSSDMSYVVCESELDLNLGP